MLFTAGIFFLYYTFWTMILPFFAASSPIHVYFPEREWAVRLPAILIVVGIFTIALFLGYQSYQVR
ncbi:hypothetical protein K474DRAFT_1591100 [Panus rudis PR-1116 ss-1]|nr:hypothetical protein K474DRAFT_1591100 [Panus rudis PR-1116 ss-1]